MDEEHSCAAYDSWILLLNLSNERKKTRIVGNALEWTTCWRFRIHSSVRFGHPFQQIEGFSTVVNGCVVHCQVEECGWILGVAGQNFLKCMHLLRYRRWYEGLLLPDQRIKRCHQEKTSAKPNNP